MPRSRRHVWIPVLALLIGGVGSVFVWQSARIQPHGSREIFRYDLAEQGGSLRVRGDTRAAEGRGIGAPPTPMFGKAGMLRIDHVTGESDVLIDVVMVMADVDTRALTMTREELAADFDRLLSSTWRASFGTEPPVRWADHQSSFASASDPIWTANWSVRGQSDGQPSARHRMKAWMGPLGQILLIAGGLGLAGWLFAAFVIWVDDGSVEGRWRRGVCIRCEYPVEGRGRCRECGAFQRRPGGSWRATTRRNAPGQ